MAPAGLVALAGTGAGNPSVTNNVGTPPDGPRLIVGPPYALRNGGLRNSAGDCMLVGKKVSPHPPRATMWPGSVAERPSRGATSVQSVFTPTARPTPSALATRIFPVFRSKLLMLSCSSVNGVYTS